MRTWRAWRGKSSGESVITGGRGFAGSFLARHLAECGDMVLGVERSASASASGFPSAGDDDGLATIDWDISEPAPEGTQAQIAEFSPEAIYHLAAISIPADCGVTEPTELARAVNVRGTQHVLGLAESLRPAPRVLLISSACVCAGGSGVARGSRNFGRGAAKRLWKNKAGRRRTRQGSREARLEFNDRPGVQPHRPAAIRPADAARMVPQVRSRR